MNLIQPCGSNNPTLFLAFSFRTAVDESLYLLASSDGLNFWTLAGSIYTPGTTSFRDPSGVLIDGTYHLAWTSGGFSAATSFAVSSGTNLIDWADPTTVDMSSVATGGNARVWAPEWFVDSDGSVHVFVSVSTGGATNFKIYEVHPTNAGFTTWSAPVLVLNANVIDAFVKKIGSTYYLFFKNNAADPGYFGYATSSSATSGYSIIQDGTTDWMGIGGVDEGLSLVDMPGGVIRAYFDHVQSGGGSGAAAPIQLNYCDTPDTFVTWGARTSVEADYIISHPTVIRSNLPQIVEDIMGYRQPLFYKGPANTTKLAGSDQVLMARGAMQIDGQNGVYAPVLKSSMNEVLKNTFDMEIPGRLRMTGGGVTVDIRWGSGDPEGVVTAPPGSTFHRSDGGSETSFYVKESGSGNTGWVPK